MSGKISHHSERHPSSPQPGTRAAVFFPGEVAALLDLENIEYDQLRKLWVLSLTSRGEPVPTGKWARFSLRDLAATEVLLGLVGPRERLAQGRHLNFRGVKEACDALRTLGFTDPLLQVPMVRDRSRIVAMVDEYVVVPANGQLALDYTRNLIEDFLATRVITDRAVRAAINAERRKARPKKSRVPISNGLGAIPNADQPATG